MNPLYLPSWLSPPEKPGFPTSSIGEKTLSCEFNLFEDWQPQPSLQPDSPQLAERTWRGNETTDWLVLSHMTTAVAGHNMANWVEAELAFVGFPSVRISSSFKTPPGLVTWDNEGTSNPLLTRLGADENLLYTGTAVIGQLRARLYVVMVRKANLAWKFFMTFGSGWGLGNDEITLMINDHHKAAHVMSSLQLNKK